MSRSLPHRAIAGLAVLAVFAACASPYRQRPRQEDLPETEVRPEAVEGDRVAPEHAAEPIGTPDDAAPEAEARTIVGTVTDDGVLRADTLAGVVADTSRVVRETVVTGALRPRGDDLRTGYRVQVFASREREVAAREAQALQGRVLEPVYVEWDDPWYKVRVGDFADRSSAEDLRARLVTAGYAEAWIAATSIRTDR